ncbi:MAG: IS66 family transposase [Holdemania filiformis]
MEMFENVLIHDYYKAYYDLESCIHAECNEHILRSLKGGVDYDDVKKCQEMIILLQTALHRKHELQAQGIQQMAEEEYKAIEEKFLNIAEQTVKEYYDEHPDIETKYVPEAIKTLKRMKEYVRTSSVSTGF